MSVDLNENDYILLRNNDPSFQTMARVSDATNFRDINQNYSKTSTTDTFKGQLELFDGFAGFLHDDKHIDLSYFFSDVTKNTNPITGKEFLEIKRTPFFKFKTNAVIKTRNSKYDLTCISKDTYFFKNMEEQYILRPSPIDGSYSVIPPEQTHTFNADAGDIIQTGYAENQIIAKKRVSSYPLQRVDKLIIHDLPSIFVYINGVKIPDSEIYVYCTDSFTDVFISEKAIGDIRYDKNEDEFEDINVTFHIDYRKVGTESFYHYEKKTSEVTSDTMSINLNKYEYHFDNLLDDVKLEELVVFADGVLQRASNVTRNAPEYTPIPPTLTSFLVDGKIVEKYYKRVERNGEMIYVLFTKGEYLNTTPDPTKHFKRTDIITITFDDNITYTTLEVYILNDIIYRYRRPIDITTNVASNKLHFYLPDDYWHDTLYGPITKNAISFFYKGKRKDDSLIKQTSRFSFVYTIPKQDNETFDENQVDFFIEDIQMHVDDSQLKTYGDDYYLLNMLGVKRCVEKLKSNISYSIFDNYTVDFGKILSDNGKMFDYEQTRSKYNRYERYNISLEQRVKEMISERPTLLRPFLEKRKIPTKLVQVMGNEKNLNISSVEPLPDENYRVYYEIYVNHMVLNSLMYTIRREHNIDIITIDKRALQPLIKDGDGNIISGINRVEMFQYNMDYIENIFYRDNINNGYTEVEIDGETYYEKEYNTNDLPFDTSEYLDEDVCAIEQVKKEWYTSADPEYSLIYPTDDGIGYQMTKHFEISDRRTVGDEKFVTFRIQLNNNLSYQNAGNFIIINKEFRLVKEIVYDNPDNSYMIDNDILIPIYQTLTYTTYDSSNNPIIHQIPFVPYIHGSEPIIICNGQKLVYGKDYTYHNPSTNLALASSFVVLKDQLPEHSSITIQYNSNKTNVLIVGYNDLNIDNKYGLVYFSELKYPISTEYMNIYVNGEKLSKYDVDILSDKLVRFKNIYRPITSILITTNLKYNFSEIEEYLDLYQESDFELLLEDIFWNCDPSKIPENKPLVNYVYKVNPMYEEFIGEPEKKVYYTYDEDTQTYSLYEGNVFMGDFVQLTPDEIAEGPKAEFFYRYFVKDIFGNYAGVNVFTQFEPDVEYYWFRFLDYYEKIDEHNYRKLTRLELLYGPVDEPYENIYYKNPYYDLKTKTYLPGTPTELQFRGYIDQIIEDRYNYTKHTIFAEVPGFEPIDDSAIRTKVLAWEALTRLFNRYKYSQNTYIRANAEMLVQRYNIVKNTNYLSEMISAPSPTEDNYESKVEDYTILQQVYLSLKASEEFYQDVNKLITVYKPLITKDTDIEDYSPIIGGKFYEKPETIQQLEMRQEARESAKLFFDTFKWNHGFDEDVDTVKQRENPYALGYDTSLPDILKIMYVNWLSLSGKTRSLRFPDMDIDPVVLRYFSIYENRLIDDTNRMDIHVRSDKMYQGMHPDVHNLPIYRNPIGSEQEFGFTYPGLQIDIRRRFFFEMLIQIIESQNNAYNAITSLVVFEPDVVYYILENDGINYREITEAERNAGPLTNMTYYVKGADINLTYDKKNKVDRLVKALCQHPLSNILYPQDFPLAPDKNGFIWTGTDYSIVNLQQY